MLLNWNPLMLFSHEHPQEMRQDLHPCSIPLLLCKLLSWCEDLRTLCRYQWENKKVFLLLYFWETLVWNMLVKSNCIFEIPRSILSLALFIVTIINYVRTYLLKSKQLICICVRYQGELILFYKSQVYYCIHSCIKNTYSFA